MKKIISYIALVFFTLSLFFSFDPCVQAYNLKDAFSVDISTPSGAIRAASGYQIGATPESVVSKVINAILSFLGIIFICFMLYGGYLWMTAMGKEQQVTKGKDLITEASIGLIIIVAAYAISYFIIFELGIFLKSS